MRIRAQDIIDEALSWVGTPWAHQQAIKGVGVDCVNFIAEVAIATGATPDVEFEKNYRKKMDGEVMLAELARYLEYVGSSKDADLIKPADIIAFHDGQDKDIPRHLGFVSRVAPRPKIVHASRRGIRHHGFNVYDRSLIHGIWRVPELLYD